MYCIIFFAYGVLGGSDATLGNREVELTELFRGSKVLIYHILCGQLNLHANRLSIFRL